jgi:hypothetical protein
MKASQSLFAVALASLAFGCDKSGAPASDSVSAQNATLAAAAAAPRVDALQGKVAGIADAVQFGGAPAATAGASEANPDAPPIAPNPLQSIYPGPATQAMVIRTGEAFIEVDKVDPAVLKVRQLAAQVGGYIANSSISGGHDQIRQATIEIKIPATKYEEAVGSLAAIGKVETVNSTAQDVGEEFVDVTARVNNSRRLEERLISLLANRTGKLDEVLRVERELARVREEIERYEGRLRYLSARVAMSTLTITVHEPAPILGSTPGENPIAAAFRRAWKNFVGVLAASIAALGVLIPLAILALLGWFGYRRWKRRVR